VPLVSDLEPQAEYHVVFLDDPSAFLDIGVDSVDPTFAALTSGPVVIHTDQFIKFFRNFSPLSGLLARIASRRKSNLLGDLLQHLGLL